MPANLFGKYNRVSIIPQIKYCLQIVRVHFLRKSLPSRRPTKARRLNSRNKQRLLLEHAKTRFIIRFESSFAMLDEWMPILDVSALIEFDLNAFPAGHQDSVDRTFAT